MYNVVDGTFIELLTKKVVSC